MSELDKAIKRFTRVSCEILDHADAQIEAINSGLGIILDAEKQVRAEMRAAEFTNCKACQSGLVLFIKDTPHADTDAINAVVETLWENCETCIAEYQEYTDAIPCEHGYTELDDCKACLNAWADANEPEQDMTDTPSEWEVQNGI